MLVFVLFIGRAHVNNARNQDLSRWGALAMLEFVLFLIAGARQ